MTNPMRTVRPAILALSLFGAALSGMGLLSTPVGNLPVTHTASLSWGAATSSVTATGSSGATGGAGAGRNQSS